MLFLSGSVPPVEFESELSYDVPLDLMASNSDFEICYRARYGNGGNRLFDIGVSRTSGAVTNLTLLALTSCRIQRKLNFELSLAQECEQALPILALHKDDSSENGTLFDFFDDQLLLHCGSQNSRLLLYPDVKPTTYLDSKGVEFGFSSDSLLVSVGIRGIGWQLAEVLL